MKRVRGRTLELKRHRLAPLTATGWRDVVIAELNRLVGLEQPAPPRLKVRVPPLSGVASGSSPETHCR